MDKTLMAAGHMMFWLDMFLQGAGTHSCPGYIVKWARGVPERDFLRGHQRNSAFADYMKSRADGSAGLAMCVRETLGRLALFPLPSFLPTTLHSFRKILEWLAMRQLQRLLPVLVLCAKLCEPRILGLVWQFPVLHALRPVRKLKLRVLYSFLPERRLGRYLQEI